MTAQSYDCGSDDLLTLLPQVPIMKNKALWLIGVGLLANAAVLLFTRSGTEISFDHAAFAQAMPGAGGANMLGARGIYMTPAQLGPFTWGAMLLDLDSSTLTVYRFNADRNRLILAAARTFRHDRFLEDYNSEGLTPAQVQKLVEQQRARIGLKTKDDQPTVEQSPHPDENKPDGK
ncbi:MAG: hypothetical protein FWD61_18225 [Phycisphaerales bacterium]|nr:hypothetical protein [Phycisphaerales bacterium]